jgi:ribosomal protein S18 acetylase RimI-like enzyme
MSIYSTRNIRSSDFSLLTQLEEAMFATTREGVLGPFYVRLCCDFFQESCFLLEADGEPAGYLLSFAKKREVYCTTLALLPKYQGTRAIVALLKPFVSSIQDDVDTCWFTVEADNQVARAMQRSLGARELEERADFYGRGRGRIISCIDRKSFERLRLRFQRIGLLEASESTCKASSRFVAEASA